MNFFQITIYLYITWYNMTMGEIDKSEWFELLEIEKND